MNAATAIVVPDVKASSGVACTSASVGRANKRMGGRTDGQRRYHSRVALGGRGPAGSGARWPVALRTVTSIGPGNDVSSDVVC